MKKPATQKPAAPKKPPRWKPVSVAQQRRQHHAAIKAAATRKKHTTAKHPHKKTVRKLALGEAVACCSAEALAASLRLAGARVSADDVEALYWATASGEDEGASILATLEAAAEYGLAGYRLASVPRPSPGRGGELAESNRRVQRGPLTSWAACRLERLNWAPANLCSSVPLILGLDLPGPHAVLAVGDTWWSWGQPWHRSAFPGAVIEEAWAVTWDAV